jgi:DNA-binding transcriptional LysR family regulator
MMSLAAYQIFATIAEQKSFIHTAELLNLTPSAVSHAVAKLEKEFGFPLFIRNKSRVTLTDNGQHILSYIHRVLNADEQLMQIAKQLQGLETGTVRIGAFNSVCVHWIPKIINTFRKKYPKIEIVVLQGGYADIIQWLKDCSIDLGFVSIPSDKMLHVEAVFQDEMLCVTPKSFIARNPQYVTKEEIEGMPFIMQRNDYGKESIRLFSKFGISSVSSSCTSINDESIIALVEGNLGISFLPHLTLKRLDYDMNVYSFYPKEYRTIGIGCLSYDMLSPAAREMYQHIIHFTKELKAGK